VKKSLYLVGGGSHCLSCIDVIHAVDKYNIVGIIDVKENIGKTIGPYKISHDDSSISDLAKEPNTEFLLTLGQQKSSSLREKLAKSIESSGGSFATIISPLAYISDLAHVDKGSIIMHHALLNAESKIGKHCIINTKALVEHHAIIGNFCHLATGAIVNGSSTLKDSCFVGSGSIVVDQVEVPENTFIKAGERYHKSR